MIRKSMAAAAVAALLTLGGTSAAFADDGGAAGDSNYTPYTPTTPSLIGSTASGICVNDVPYISFHVVMSDPDNISTSHDAKLILTNGSDTATLDLGTLGADNTLSGRVLWPGAKVDHGVATGWPGWTTTKNGDVVPTDDNYAWTRGDITATIDVNPALQVPLDYPAATSACAAPAAAAASLSGTDASGQILPVTGLNVPVVPISIGGGIVLLAGAALLLARRRRHS